MIQLEKLLILFLLATVHIDTRSNKVAQDMLELRTLLNQTKVLPNQQKVLAHYKTILEKKWSALETDFKTMLSFSPYGTLLKDSFLLFQCKSIEKPYAREKDLKKEFSEPLKKLSKKDIWLTDMLTPFDETQKQVFRDCGVTDEYLEHIFLVTHTPDKEIPFPILDEFDKVSKFSGGMVNQLNRNNKIILLSKDFFQNSLPQQLLILNHEIAHTKQIRCDSFKSFLYHDFINTKRSQFTKNFALIFMEMEADILALLQLNPHDAEDALSFYKLLDDLGGEKLKNEYPSNRYDIALTIIKSLATGNVPDKIPDTWINNVGQELKSKIHEFQKTHDFEHQNNLFSTLQ